MHHRRAAVQVCAGRAVWPAGPTAARRRRRSWRARVPNSCDFGEHRDRAAACSAGPDSAATVSASCALACGECGPAGDERRGDGRVRRSISCEHLAPARRIRGDQHPAVEACRGRPSAARAARRRAHRCAARGGAAVGKLCRALAAPGQLGIAALKASSVMLAWRSSAGDSSCGVEEQLRPGRSIGRSMSWRRSS